MEQGLLQDPRIRALLEKEFVEVWLHTDGKVKGAQFRQLQMEYVGSNALPYWAIVDPEKLAPLRKQDYTDDPEVFLRFLRGE